MFAKVGKFTKACKDMEKNSVGFIGVHVGAGNHSEARRSEYKKVCNQACEKAIKVLQQRKTALDALVVAIKILEDCPLTNAGVGSNLNFDGNVECDASIMDGQTNHFGAVGALQGIRNPIVVAKKLVEEQNIVYPSGRVPPMFLCGEGAHDWAIKHGVLGVSRQSLVTDKSLKSYKKYFKCSQDEEENLRSLGKKRKLDEEESLLDTVGAVCVDNDGNICSGVSSGGVLLKYPGRIGQAAMYGAGCWASNITKNCPVGIACSSSGCGEELIKTLLCKECADICVERFTSQGGMTALQELMQSKFLDSPRLSCTDAKQGGIILLKCQIDSSSELQKMKADFSWAHTTQTMAVGYMAVQDQTPEFQLSRLEAASVPGCAIQTRGIVLTHELSRLQDKNNSS